MNDPHVEALHYKIGTGSDSISYGDPPPLAFGNNIGTFSLSAGLLTVELAEHFPDEQSARQLVDPFLRAWELHMDLTANLGQIRFTFENSKIIDRNPPASAGLVVQCKAASISILSGNARIRLTCNKYPDPPASFAITPDVELFHARWRHYREGKQSLQTMAFFILDSLKRSAGSTAAISHTYEISRNVLDKIGYLASYKGDEMTARKSDFIKMTGAEHGWLEATIKKVILRVGEHASGTPLTKLTLSDLPPLP